MAKDEVDVLEEVTWHWKDNKDKERCWKHCELDLWYANPRVDTPISRKLWVYIFLSSEEC